MSSPEDNRCSGLFGWIFGHKVIVVYTSQTKHRKTHETLELIKSVKSMLIYDSRISEMLNSALEPELLEVADFNYCTRCGKQFESALGQLMLSTKCNKVEESSESTEDHKA